MIDLFFVMVEAIRQKPELLLSGLQLTFIVVAIVWLMPRRWLIMIGLAALVLLAIVLIGRMP
jgi:hypothetical protein